LAINQLGFVVTDNQQEHSETLPIEEKMSAFLMSTS